MWPVKYCISLLFLFLFVCLRAQYITYESDVKPILQKHCVSCHSPGEVGPMPLTNYEEVSAYGSMIEYVTSHKLMPPWYADPSYSHFSNERGLSEEEIQTIRQWVEGDMKPGALPYGMAISNVAGVTVYPREPDLVLSMDASFEQYGIYMDQYQVFVLPVNLEEDTWIEAIQFVPGNKKIVRHAAISVSPHGAFDSLDKWDPRYGYYSFGGLGKTPLQPHWYSWSPGQPTTYYKEGQGKFIPKGSDLIVYIHYGPTGKPLSDSSFVELHFASERIKNFITTVPLINPYNLTGDSLFIPANTKKNFHASYTLPYDIELLSLTPQANLISRKWEVYAEIPGQREPIRLLKINDWNINWKQTFQMTEPLHLPAGAIIHTLAHYDNTVDNLCNPSEKPVDVHWGSHLFSEMFFVHFEFIAKLPSTRHPVLMHAPAVISSDDLSVYVLPAKRGNYRFEVSATNGALDPVRFSINLKAGQQHIPLRLPGLPFGNYVLHLYNDDDEMVAAHIFVKMKEDGM